MTISTTRTKTQSTFALPAHRQARTSVSRPKILDRLVRQGLANKTRRDQRRLGCVCRVDVTLLPETDDAKARIGIRWQTGATEEIITKRGLRAWDLRCTPSEIIELIRGFGAGMSHHDVAAALNAAGHRSGTGKPFTFKAVQWIRHIHRMLPVANPYAPGELSVTQAAGRLGIGAGVVYYWIQAGQLPARRGHGNRLCIPWNDDIEALCRNRIAQSGHLKPRQTTITTEGAAV